MAERNKPKLDLRKVGATGLPTWAGRVYDEELRELEGERGRKILREMSEQDPIIGGILYGVEMLSRQVPWTVVPAQKPKEDEPSEKSKKVARFVDECLSDMNPTFGNTLSEILSMLIYGWSWLEILYKRREGINVNDQQKSSRFDDGKIGWAGWSIRSQETLDTWEFDDDDSSQLRALNQWVPWELNKAGNTRNRIPRSKSLHFVTRSRRQNPEGVSLLRNCYRPWTMKKNIEAIEGIGIERDLAGLPVLWAPIELFASDATEDQAALFESLKEIVTNIRRDEQEGVLMPMAYMDEDGKQPSYKLELLSTGGERQFDTNAIINRYDERIAMSMLADFILMGHQAVGSFALSTTKTGLFSLALSAIMDIITEEINDVGIPQLVILNGWKLEDMPTLVHGKIESADLGKLGEFLKAVFDAGMNVFPNPELEKKLLEMAGLPPTDVGAGRLPMPIDPTTGKPFPVNPLDPTQPLLPPPPVADPDPQAQTRPEDTPAAKPGGSATRRLQTVTKNANGAPVGGRSRAASEQPAKGKHFVPLAQRVAKVATTISTSMDGPEYTDFLTAVMDAGKFSALPEEYQEVIRQAEAVE